MRRLLSAILIAVIVVALLGAAGVAYVVATGLSARAQPGALETRLARSVRSLAIPGDVKRMANPAPKSAEVIADGMNHFADHCASCHANDGSGKTEMGQGLFPKAPDMRQPATQQLTDGELFYIIENGVRFTGMPAWSTGAADGEAASWHLVHFIRTLPTLTPEQIEQMEALNPRPPDEIRQQIEEERFLKGDGGDPAPPPKPHAH
ncbi:MAG TPA: c-type cytochrome [Vicinamibacterales bacterium]|jgi:mono/diheme cytochrome c family protein